MTRRRRFLYIGAGLGVAAVVMTLLLLGKTPKSIRGAVVTSDTNSARELPIADVEVTMLSALEDASVRSNPSGLFEIPLKWPLRPGQELTLQFRHPDYQNLDLSEISGDQLYVARLAPLVRLTPASPQGAEVTIANVVVKYSIRTTTTINVGSAVRTFQVVNTGNVPCKGRRPCSPDGKWKAATGAVEMDAGVGYEFRNARTSCIAGPCPFTKIEGGGVRLSHENRTLQVSAVNWSDTATFLVEAEVYRPMVNDVLRQSYPVIFDQALTFTLPASADGVSIEAVLNGDLIVFPLGPALILSWANCQLLVNKDKTLVYRCELRPGYRFAAPGINADNRK